MSFRRAEGWNCVWARGEILITMHIRKDFSSLASQAKPGLVEMTFSFIELFITEEHEPPCASRQPLTFFFTIP